MEEDNKKGSLVQTVKDILYYGTKYFYATSDEIRSDIEERPSLSTKYGWAALIGSTQPLVAAFYLQSKAGEYPGWFLPVTISVATWFRQYN